MKRWSALCGWVVFVVLLPVFATPVVTRAGDRSPFEFALIGDYPYFERDYAGMPHLLDDLREAPNLDWILHVGDLHNPRNTECSRELYEERRDLFLGLGKPFVLTPGDNDWVDCESDQQGYLAMVREIFYPEPGRVRGGEGFPVRTQSAESAYPELVENVMWQRGGVVFATMHLIGASRDWRPFQTEREARLRLIEAGEVWLDSVFRVAMETNAPGVLIAMQVDPWPTSGNVQMFQVVNPDALDHARAFKRPIVIAHGDTHVFRVDKPLHDEHLELLQNVTRVESFGSPDGHWVRVRVEPDRPEVFSFREEWVEENLYTLVARDERKDGLKGDDRLEKLLIPLRIFQAIPTLFMLIGVVTVLRLGWLGIRRWRRRA